MQLSFTQKHWQEPQHTGSNPAHLVALLMRERHLAPVTQESTLTSPEKLQDMDKACARIRSACSQKERIAIFGDYDCDGVTSALQLLRYFQRNDIDPLVRLPHRQRDGYGLSQKIVQEFMDAKVTLLITVDTGIASIDEIRTLQENGIDVIVTDHHQPQEELPPAHAMVHPSLSSEYPLPHPAGAGVAFQVLRALEGGGWEDMHTDQALAMIGTVADLVELTGDNRVLVQQGLQSLNDLPDGPLLQLLEKANLDPASTSSTDIAFRIAPRINAAGRMADPTVALQALLDGGDALDELADLNADRQEETHHCLQQAMEELGIDEHTTEELPPLLATASKDYPPGIIGLIAGKLTERTGRPSIVASIEGETYTASLRSPGTYHITEGLVRCQELLERFGGHAQAAGCTTTAPQWSGLCKALEEDIDARTDREILHPTIHIDAGISPRDITLRLCEQLNMLEPYGQGNREPVFLLENVKIDQLRCIGTDGSHLQGRLAGRKLIGFGFGELIEQCDQPLDLAVRIGIDTWNGTRAPQITLVDARAHVQVLQSV